MINGTNCDEQLLQNGEQSSSNKPESPQPDNSVMPLIEEQNSVQEPEQGKTVIYVRKSLSKKAKRRLKYCGIIISVLVVLLFLFAFVGIPIIFMNSIALQRLVMFTNWGLPSDVSYFRKYELKPGLRNLYVSVKDIDNKNVSLGVWHLLPYVLRNTVITETEFDFEFALKNTTLGVLLYFHGTGEDRSNSLMKYTIFKFFFHVITFDYRSYGDSTKNELSEDAVVNDCVQLYEWLITKTSAPVIIWGHSLGTALAARTVAILQSKANIPQPAGLVLEAPFTKMSDELYAHPYGKIFAWLPWFKATVIKPLEKNGFVFNTEKHLLDVKCPVMILCSEDDSIVPYEFGEKLYEVAKSRAVLNTTLYYQFAYDLDYDHYFLYQDPFLPYFINYFRYLCTEGRGNTTN